MGFEPKSNLQEYTNKKVKNADQGLKTPTNHKGGNNFSEKNLIGYYLHRVQELDVTYMYFKLTPVCFFRALAKISSTTSFG